MTEYYKNLELRTVSPDPETGYLDGGFEIIADRTSTYCASIASLGSGKDGVSSRELLVAAYNAFIKAGHKLGIDPLILANEVDIAELSIALDNYRNNLI